MSHSQFYSIKRLYLSRTSCKPTLPASPCAHLRRGATVSISKREKVQCLPRTVGTGFHQPTIGTCPNQVTTRRSTCPFLPCHSDTAPSAILNHTEITIECGLTPTSKGLWRSRLRRGLPAARSRRSQPQSLPPTQASLVKLHCVYRYKPCIDRQLVTNTSGIPLSVR